MLRPRSFAKFSSVRVRLLLWNTLTLAFVLIALGVAFRFLAEDYLLGALDREIKVQAQRFQEKHQVQMVLVTSDHSDKPLKTQVRVTQSSAFQDAAPLHSVITASSDTLPPNKDTLLHVFSSSKNVNVRILEKKAMTRYKVIRRDDTTTTRDTRELDRTSQFLYRTFDLKGKPLAPLAPRLPFDFAPLPLSEQAETNKSLENYRPWDQVSFQAALTGNERLSTVLWEGASLRILTQPLYDTETNAQSEPANRRIIGIVQIAAPLGQVTRDIAGLTRTLLLILPLALLVAGGTGLFLTTAALRPVKSLTHAATHICPEQLSQRLPVSGTDEFDALAGAFNHALDRVEQTFRERERAMEQLRRFTAYASHELRTPLTTIKANTGVALKETEPSEEHLHALRQIDRATDRMTALVRDLLVLARSDAGQIAPDLRLLLLEAILQEAIGDCENALAMRPHAPITLQGCEPELTVSGDANHLHRLFLNLLENAARYTPADGHITVSVRSQEHAALIAIQDTGCGIAPEHLPHLGERFYRADSGRNRKHGGAGLGLAICRAIAAQHQGTLSFQSEPGKGTTVTIHLPRA